MSLKLVHQVIIFAGITISLVFAAWCFTDPGVAGDPHYVIKQPRVAEIYMGIEADV